MHMPKNCYIKIVPVLFGLILQLQYVKAVKIGSILVEQEDVHVVTGMDAAVVWSNQNIFKPNGMIIEHKIVFLNKNSSLLEITKKFCDLVDVGVEAIFGSSDTILSNKMQVLCQQLNIPFFQTHWSVNDGAISSHNIAINLFPESQIIEAMIDLSLELQWTRITLVYKDEYSLLHLRKFLENNELSKNFVHVVKVDNEDYISALQTVRRIQRCRYVDQLNSICSKVTQVVIHLNTADTYQFLLSALQLGMISVKYWYLLSMTDLKDSPPDYLELFRHNNVRVVAMDLLDPEHNQGYKFKEMKNIAMRHWNDNFQNSVYFPKTEMLLTFDAVLAFAHAYVNARADDAVFTKASCPYSVASKSRQNENVIRFNEGKRIYNWVNQIEFDGLSGRVAFKDGKRKNTDFQLYQLGFKGDFEMLGSWGRKVCQCEDGDLDLNLNGTSLDHSKLHLSPIARKPHFHVTTIEEEPYVMIKKNFKGKVAYKDVGLRHLEGFCLDLLFLIAKENGFSYSISLVEDRKYGSKLEYENGTAYWNGMIGEILAGKADLAVAPLTVNFQRNSYVDFTKPFLSLGISILFRIPTEHKPELFSFLNPLSIETWCYIGVAAVVLSVATFIIARLSPYEWYPDPAENTPCCDCQQQQQFQSQQIIVRNDRNGGRVITHAVPPPPPQILPTRFLTTNYTYTGSLWYILSTLLKGGNDFGPRAMSTRLLGGAWWVFTLVMTSAYTANLAAVLTVDKIFVPIKSMEDLANQTKIQYGTLGGGSTMQFFQESKLETHKKMWDYMKNRLDQVSVSGNKVGVARVLKENYAYLMESSSLEYAVGSNCNLTQIGGVLGSRGYGIAMQKGSKWTDVLSRIILQLGEKGVLELLRSRWLKNSMGVTCGGKSSMKEGSKALNMQNVSGLFILLLAGILSAILFVIIEFCIMTKTNSTIDKKDLCCLMRDELKFAVRLDPSKKKHNLSQKCDICDQQVDGKDMAYQTRDSKMSKRFSNDRETALVHIPEKETLKCNEKKLFP